MQAVSSDTHISCLFCFISLTYKPHFQFTIQQEHTYVNRDTCNGVIVSEILVFWRNSAVNLIFIETH